MSLITNLFDVQCFNVVSRVFSMYYCLIWKMISSMWPPLKVDRYILIFKQILVETTSHYVSLMACHMNSIMTISVLSIYTLYFSETASWNHFILLMHMSYVFYLIFMNNHIALKNYGGFCVMHLNASNYNYMATSTI